MTMYQILTLAGVPTLVGIIIALVIKRPLDRRVQAAEASQATQQQQSQAIMLGVQALLRTGFCRATNTIWERGGLIWMTGPTWRMTGSSIMLWVVTEI